MARWTITFLKGETNALSQIVGDYLPVFRRDALSNLSTVGAVVHEEKFNVFFVSDEELAEARSEHVSGLLILLGTDLGLSNLASEASADAGVNTSLLSPGSLQNHK